mgnify:CR=1 FL=1
MNVVIGHITVKDAAKWAEYRSQVPATLAPWDAELVFRGEKLAVLGGTLAAGTHFTKASARAMINTSPEPFSNIAASTGEDVVVLTGLWLMFAHPWIMLVLLALLVALMLWLLPRLWRGVAALVSSFSLPRPAAGGHS